MEPKVNVDKLREIAVDETPEEKSLNENSDLKKVMVHIALKIQRKMRTEGLSREEIAERLNISEETVDLYLTGRYEFTLRDIVNIEKSLWLHIIDRNISDRKIEAIQYNNINFNEVEEFAGQQLECWLRDDAGYLAGAVPPLIDVVLPTPFGDVKVSYGDWIVRSSSGNLYAVKNCDYLSAEEVLKVVSKKISEMKDLEPEFQQVIDENFFDLL